MTPDDLLFMVFRHKGMVLAFLCLGLAGAIAARVVRPPVFVSQAKLQIHYVMEPRTVNPTGPDAGEVRLIEQGAQGTIAAEVEILSSLDVVTNAVRMVGAEKILAKKGGGNDPLAAAGVVASGLEVEPPKTTIITVSLKHPDPEVARMVLSAIIEAYQEKHLEVYQGRLGEYYAKQMEESRSRLVQTEQELKNLRTQAPAVFPDQDAHSYQAQIAKKMEELWDAQRELAERKAVLGDSVTGIGEMGAPQTGVSVPPDKVNDYAQLLSDLDGLKRNERELLRTYREAYPLVQTVRAQMQELSTQKTGLEAAFPALAQMGLVSGPAGTNAVGGDVTAGLAEIRRLNARVGALRNVLSNIQASASLVLELDPKIAQVQRRHDEEQRSYEFFLSSLEQTRRSESRSAGTANNISVVQNPTPSGLDYKKTLKLVGIVLVGCIGLGLGLVFLIETFLDRSIKRVVDVERRLRLPVFLTIPDATWGGRLRLPWLSSRRNGKSSNGAEQAASSAIEPWQPDHLLRHCAEGLRERLMTYFEVNDLNLKKPKLVAITSCGEGAGVSSLAGGLAAALSETGEGNVLLVDMNVSNGVAHSFYRGKPGSGLANALEPELRAEAQVQQNLYLASLQNGAGDGKLPLAVTKQFNHLVPKLKASDYDYIIFDMPPVAPTSLTARLASHMDITLLVIEAEKTGQQTATRASALMRESKVKLATILNKYRQHVPARLSQDG